MTPATVHAGLADDLSAQRQEVLQAAYQTHPERFVAGKPKPPRVPDAVWINPPNVVSYKPAEAHIETTSRVSLIPSLDLSHSY